MTSPVNSVDLIDVNMCDTWGLWSTSQSLERCCDVQPTGQMTPSSCGASQELSVVIVLDKSQVQLTSSAKAASLKTNPHWLIVQLFYNLIQGALFELQPLSTLSHWEVSLAPSPQPGRVPLLALGFHMERQTDAQTAKYNLIQKWYQQRTKQIPLCIFFKTKQALWSQSQFLFRLWFSYLQSIILHISLNGKALPWSQCSYFLGIYWSVVQDSWV